MTDAEDREAAWIELVRIAQPDVEPTLTETELEDILDRHQRASRWVTLTDLDYGDVVLPTVRMGSVFTVTTAGTTGATEPTWDSFTITDGDVELEEFGADFTSVYDVRAAVRECWEVKANKASELITSKDSGEENLIHDQCERKARYYSSPMVG